MIMRLLGTIRGRLLVGFGTLVMLLVGAGLVGRTSMTSTSAMVDRVLDNVQRENRLSTQLSADITRALDAANGYLSSRDTADAEEFRRLAWDAHRVQRAMNALPGQTAEEIGLIAEIDTRLSDVEVRYNLAHRLLDLGRRTAAESERGAVHPVVDTLLAEIDRLGLLPAPFPIEDLLDERDLRHVKRLYGIGGLSYGNLSIRKDERRFWMSASGVDKSRLDVVGRDVLLVSDYDERSGAIVLSVPPGIEPRRVSVDAIEHWTIYRENPSVGAILHVHAWIDGIEATEINFPCGTAELAENVAALVRGAPDPGHAVVGLRNHGITATGESLTEILDRIEPVLLPQVPMS